MLLAISTRDGEPARAWLRRLSPHIVSSGPEVLLASDDQAGIHVEAEVTVVAEPAECAARIAGDYRAAGNELLAGVHDDASFIVSDPRRRRLVASSDLLSRIPLSYWSSQGTTIVSSRLMAMLRHPSAPRRLDDTYLAHVISDYGCPRPGCTPIAGIRRLAAGQRLYISETGLRVAAEALLRPKELPRRSLEDAHAELRGVVTAGVQREASSCSSLALSGGLDSAVVGAVLAGHVPRVKAFSMLADVSSAAGEALGVEAFGRAFPNVEIHRVDVSTTASFPDLRSSELRDDPPLPAVCLLPGRLRMWQLAREAGTPDMFDGEGGDELFSLFVTPLDAFRRGDVRAAIGYVQAQRGWRRMLLWRSLVLPNLPNSLRSRWLASWAHDGRLVPPYVRTEARSHPAFLDALDSFLASMVHKELRSAVQEWLSAPFAIGTRLARQLLAAERGIRLISPLVERGVVEFVLGLPPRWLLANGIQKGFLREAWRGRLPESVRVRPKDDTMGDYLITPILCSTEARNRLKNPVVRERLDAWVRFDRVDAMMGLIGAGATVRPAILWQLEALVTFADWYARAHRELGVD